jgi:hypothetical protein
LKSNYFLCEEGLEIQMTISHNIMKYFNFVSKKTPSERKWII